TLAFRPAGNSPSIRHLTHIFLLCFVCLIVYPVIVTHFLLQGNAGKESLCRKGPTAGPTRLSAAPYHAADLTHRLLLLQILQSLAHMVFLHILRDDDE